MNGIIVITAAGSAATVAGLLGAVIIGVASWAILFTIGGLS